MSCTVGRHAVRLSLIRRLVSPLAVLAAVMATGFVAAPASAQFGAQSGFAEAFKPDFLTRDLAVFNEFLALEEWQRPIMESMLDDYNVSFQAGVEGVKERMQNARGDFVKGGPEAVAKIMEPVEAWIQEKSKLKAEFIENLRGQLSDGQMQRWPKFERALRRDKTLEQGELAGESVNLVALVKGLGLDTETTRAIETAVEEYEVALDLALVQREEVMKSQQETVKQAMIDMDFDAGMAATEKIMAARVHVREVQDAGAAAIAAALTDAGSGEFLKRWREKAYPKVYREQPFDKVLEAARQLADLTDRQRSAIDKIEIDYRAALEAVNADMLKAMQAEEPRQAKRRVENMRNRPVNSGGGAAHEEAVQDTIARRDRVIEEARRALEAVLTPEQYALMPVQNRSPRALREANRESAEKAAAKEVDGKRGRDNRMANPGASSPPGEGDSKRPKGKSAPGLGAGGGAGPNGDPRRPPGNAAD